MPGLREPDADMYADAYAVCTRDRQRLEAAIPQLQRENMRLREALAEIVHREARSDYRSIFSAPGEFALIARAAIREASTCREASPIPPKADPASGQEAPH